MCVNVCVCECIVGVFVVLLFVEYVLVYGLVVFVDVLVVGFECVFDVFVVVCDFVVWYDVNVM